MNVMLINGSPHEKGCTYTALAEVAKTLEENGVSTEWLSLGASAVPGCIACGRCRKTGRCFVDDKVNVLLDALDRIDGIVVGSPVYYAGPSGQLTAFLDRAFFAAGGRFAGKLGAAVVSCRRGGASAAYDCLHKYFGISNMPIVTSQYWNQVHGNTPSEVRQDLEGMQTMRALGRNMAWLLRCIALGREHGVDFPSDTEPHVSTNFIR